MLTSCSVNIESSEMGGLQVLLMMAKVEFCTLNYVFRLLHKSDGFEGQLERLHEYRTWPALCGHLPGWRSRTRSCLTSWLTTAVKSWRPRASQVLNTSLSMRYPGFACADTSPLTALSGRALAPDLVAKSRKSCTCCLQDPLGGLLLDALDNDDKDFMTF